VHQSAQEDPGDDAFFVAVDPLAHSKPTLCRAQASLYPQETRIDAPDS